MGIRIKLTRNIIQRGIKGFRRRGNIIGEIAPMLEFQKITIRYTER